MTSIQKQFTYQVQYNKKTYYDRFLEGASIRLRINLLVLLVQWMDFDHLACPANSVPLNNWCFLLTVSFGSYSICSKADFDKQGFSPHTRKYWTKTEIIIVIRSQIKNMSFELRWPVPFVVFVIMIIIIIIITSMLLIIIMIIIKPELWARLASCPCYTRAQCARSGGGSTPAREPGGVYSCSGVCVITYIMMETILMVAVIIVMVGFMVVGVCVPVVII